MKISQLFIWGLLLTVVSCEEVIEPNISNNELLLLAPGEGVTLTSDSVGFWWEHVEGAREYHLRVVSPSFDQAESVWADSITTNNLVFISLPGGTYEWEVRALNAGYSTNYYYRTFSVDSTNATIDISNLSVTLLAPGAGYVSDSESLSFWWESLEGAIRYELFVVTPNFENIQNIVLDTTTTSDILNLRLDSGTYEWGVRGIGANSRTKFSTRSLKIIPE